MLRSMLAALALGMLCTATTFAGNCGCGCGGSGGGLHGRATQAWSGYRGADCGSDSCGDACSDPCNACTCKGRGCHRCCFPVIRGAVHLVGKVINFVIPHPCCRSGCKQQTAGCCDTACNGWDPTACNSCGSHDAPSYMPNHAGNPFIDDAPAPASPVPMKEARGSRAWQAPIAAKPASQSTLKNVVQKNLKPTPATNYAAPSKVAARSVAKVTHDEQIEEELSIRLSDDESDLAPIAPSSIRLVGHSERREPTPAPTRTRLPANPLR